MGRPSVVAAELALPCITANAKSRTVGSAMG
jgi:hypothetical protein